MNLNSANDEKFSCRSQGTVMRCLLFALLFGLSQATPMAFAAAREAGTPEAATFAGVIADAKTRIPLLSRKMSELVLWKVLQTAPEGENRPSCLPHRHGHRLRNDAGYVAPYF